MIKCNPRHWFTYYNWTGTSAPSCRRCGADNPKYRPEDDPFAERVGTDDLETVAQEVDRVIREHRRS